MDRLRQFMYGRYGFDKFSQVLVVISFIISLMGSVSRSGTISYLAYIPLGYAIFRVLSKDIKKRTKENFTFLNKINFLKSKLQNGKRTSKKPTTHRYFKCPKCKQEIRVPSGKGKICITCPKCRTEFVKRT